MKQGVRYTNPPRHPLLWDRQAIPASVTSDTKGMEASGRDCFPSGKRWSRNCLLLPTSSFVPWKEMGRDHWGGRFVTWWKDGNTQQAAENLVEGSAEPPHRQEPPASEVPWSLLKHTVINGLRFKPLLWLSVNYCWKQYWIFKKFFFFWAVPWRSRG